MKYSSPQSADDVHTYGLFPHPYDPDRHITKINFFGDDEPLTKTTRDEANKALHNLYQGKQIIDSILSEEEAGYIRDFCNADLTARTDLDHGELIRFRRRIFVYRSILAESGFEYDGHADVRGLFSKELMGIMSASDEMKLYVSALESGRMTWEVAGDFTKAFASWVKGKDSSFRNFDAKYATTHDGRKWSDVHLLNLLGFHDNTRGRTGVQDARVWHDLNSDSDYAQNIVQQLREGKLVIVDQILGDETMNRQAAERIVRLLFQEQQRAFSNPRVDPDTGVVVQPPPVIVFIEEAHNLLPRANEDDPTHIWTRLAKEGAKFNIGMVYSTQEPSSIQTQILKNTENWFIAHLNNTDETNQIRKFNDFGDFTNSVINVSEPRVPQSQDAVKLLHRSGSNGPFHCASSATVGSGNSRSTVIAVNTV